MSSLPPPSPVRGLGRRDWWLRPASGQAQIDDGLPTFLAPRGIVAEALDRADR